MFLFLLFTLTVMAMFLAGLHFWVRYVFGEQCAGKATVLCLKLIVAIVAVAILIEPVGLMVGIFWATVKLSHGWTLVIPLVIVGFPLIRLAGNNCRRLCHRIQDLRVFNKEGNIHHISTHSSANHISTKTFTPPVKRHRKQGDL